MASKWSKNDTITTQHRNKHIPHTWQLRNIFSYQRNAHSPTAKVPMTNKQWGDTEIYTIDISGHQIYTIDISCHRSDDIYSLVSLASMSIILVCKEFAVKLGTEKDKSTNPTNILQRRKYRWRTSNVLSSNTITWRTGKASHGTLRNVF